MDVHTPYALKDHIKAIPGSRWVKEAKVWRVPRTTTAAEHIARMARRTGELLSGDAAFDVLLADARAAHQARKAARSGDSSAAVPTLTKAWHHQQCAFDHARHMTASMLAMDMGTGKSLVAIGLLEEWQARRVLIVCPKNVVGVWPHQLAQHSLRAWSCIAPRKGTVAKRTEQVLAALDLADVTGDPLAVIVNYESVIRDPLYGVLAGHHWDVVIADESHRMKQPGGRQSIAMAAIGARANRRLALTGTPMSHSPLDIYAQFRFLDKAVLGASFARFKAQYAVEIEHRIVAWRDSALLSQMIGKLAYLCDAEDVLDLPDAVETERTVELTDSAKAYAQMEELMCAEVAGGTVTAANGLVRLLRLQQMTGGNVARDDSTIVRVGSEKRSLLRDVLADVPPDEPVVVFCRFVADLAEVSSVADDMGRTYAELSGNRRDALTERSTLVPGVQVVGVQIQSGGVGIDLTGAATAIYYSVGFSLGDYKQSLARIHRPGQTRPALYVHLVAENTIDETVYRALRAKEEVISEVLSALRTR